MLEQSSKFKVWQKANPNSSNRYFLASEISDLLAERGLLRMSLSGLKDALRKYKNLPVSNEEIKSAEGRFGYGVKLHIFKQSGHTYIVRDTH